MDSIVIWALLIGLVLIAGVSRRIRNTAVTLPMLYVLFGLAVGLLFRDRITLTFDDPIVEAIATLALALVLATDASRIRLQRPVSNYSLPLRLLLIGLPLTIVLGTGVGLLLFAELGLWGAAVLAVILAPTDASLGQSVVSNPLVPARIRQALNIESGLNDGIAMPFLILTLSLAVSSADQLGSGAFLLFAAQQIVFGLFAGLLVGYLGARFIRWGNDSGWMTRPFQKICWLALIILAYGTAGVIGGNGFIASFVFGITSGRVFSSDEMASLDDFAEIENALLMLMTYMVFGMVMLLPALERIDATVVLYTLLSLTVVRMLSVAISLLGTNLRPVSVMFMGWFGPRGIASILYVLTVVAADELVGREAIYTAVMITVFISVLAHGLTAAPLSDRYGTRIAELVKAGEAGPETMPVPEMHTRAETGPAAVAVNGSTA